MSTKSEVAVPEPASVPALAPTPGSTLTYDDIALPTLYVAQRTSTAVENNLVNYGDLFVAQGADDAEAEVLWAHGSGDAGLVIYPLHMAKRWTWTDGSELSSWPFGDGQVPAEAAELARSTGKPYFLTYGYVVLIPSYDMEMPVNFRVNSKSGRAAHNKITAVYIREGAQVVPGPAFRVTTDKKERGGNKWAVPVVVSTEGEPEQLDAARTLYQQIVPGLQAAAEAATTDAPPAV